MSDGGAEDEAHLKSFPTSPVKIHQRIGACQNVYEGLWRDAMLLLAASQFGRTPLEFNDLSLARAWHGYFRRTVSGQRRGSQSDEVMGWLGAVERLASGLAKVSEEWELRPDQWEPLSDAVLASINGV